MRKCHLIQHINDIIKQLNALIVDETVEYSKIQPSSTSLVKYVDSDNSDIKVNVELRDVYVCGSTAGTLLIKNRLKRSLPNIITVNIFGADFKNVVMDTSLLTYKSYDQRPYLDAIPDIIHNAFVKNEQSYKDIITNIKIDGERTGRNLELSAISLYTVDNRSMIISRNSTDIMMNLYFTPVNRQDKNIVMVFFIENKCTIDSKLPGDGEQRL